MAEGAIFEHRYRHHVWQVQIIEKRGERTAGFWPWYTDAEGNLQPCSARFGGGFHMPFNSLIELRDAINGAIDETNSRVHAPA